MNVNTNNIAIKAKEIAEKIGYPIIRENYYTDCKIGSIYEFDSLRIEYYNEECSKVYIYISDILLFRYDFYTNESEHKNENWVNLIDEIYKTIPSILNKRNIENENKNQKIYELKSLEDSFKYYIECFKCKQNILEYIKSKLEEYNISCLSETRSSLIYNSSADYDHYHVYIVHVIYYFGKKVAEFKSDKFNVFPNIDNYIEQFQPGEWSDIFKNIINQARDFDEKLIDSSINDHINAIIRKLNRNETK